MNNMTDEYGEFTSLYEGKGLLNDLPCELKVGRKPDSTIILSCSSKDIFDPGTDSIELAGHLKDGTPVSGYGKGSFALFIALYECRCKKSLFFSFSCRISIDSRDARLE